MMRRAGFLILSLALPLLLLGYLLQVPAAGQAPEPGRIGPALQERLAENQEGNVRFLVKMRGEADLIHNLPAARADRRHLLIQRLQDTARGAQEGLIQQLAALRDSGQVVSYQPLWIINAIAVEGHPNVPPLLATRDDVRQIVLDTRLQYVVPLETVAYSEPEAGWNLARVRAPHAWRGLGLTGEGVTVAIMDTGVDWLHQELAGNYRGDDGSGPAVHEGNWYDAVERDNQQPVDPHGHGTHVAGTIAGANGIGVAPGAQWIAVRVFDEDGSAWFSTLHEGFQWLLAPAGNPDLAPDIVNGSWGGHGLGTEFVDDVEALSQAGIIPVFAAGNDGPQEGTIGAPAAYTDTFAVAASDDLDEVAWFSSRGPSPLTKEPKPELAAPGAYIYSTLPGNEYGYSSGTSMAAPHVSGAAALLLEMDPTLSPQAIRKALVETAVPLGDETPDINSGWGRIDAYAAAASVGSFGELTGVARADAGPIARATVTITTPHGEALRYETDALGRYIAWLLPGQYQMHAAKFGYADSPVQSVSVTAGVSGSRDLLLTRLPHGRVHGIVRDETTQEGLGVTINVLSTPVTVAVASSGSYSLDLPSGHSYVLRAAQAGYRLQEQTVTVVTGGNHRRDFTLVRAPSILLVDGGRWYYDSQISYYRLALVDAGYGYDEWTIGDPAGAPAAEALAPYDVVIWSAPQDAPGRIGAGAALEEYLNEGGNLLVSGQNVARLDGSGPTGQSWWHNDLGGIYLGTATAPFNLHGLPDTAFAPINLELNGPDSAQNQLVPSQVGPRDGTLTRSILAYSTGRGAALHSGWCRPFEIVFLGFGLEGVSLAIDRARLIESSLETVTAPPVEAALSLDPVHSEGIVLPGETVTYSLRLRNLSEVQTTTVGLDLDSPWNASINTSSLLLGPCDHAPVTVTLHVPSGLPADSENTIILRSDAANGSTAIATIHNKTPAQHLLVDDHRWYDRVELYEGILEHFNLNHDVWSTERFGSPRPQLLKAYQMVFWYTAYDWFEPVMSEEGAALVEYLEDGGRLFLTSQDYLFYNLNEALTGRYLGVLDYAESVTPTAAIAGLGTVAGDPAGPIPLSYDPYQNFSDGLTPADDAQVHVWSNRGIAAGVATARAEWRSVFWGFPFETLPPSERERMFGSVVGWLSDVGDSTLEVSPRIGPQQQPRYYTLTVRNWQNAPTHQMAVTATVDSHLAVDASSVTGATRYDPASHSVTWLGSLDPGDEHQITFRTQPDGLAKSADGLGVTGYITYGSDGMAWEKTLMTWVGAPDLTGTVLEVSPQRVLPGDPVTYVLRLENRSLLSATNVSATLYLPQGLTPITNTLSAGSGTVTLGRGRVGWRGNVSAMAQNTVTLQLTSRNSPQERFIAAGAVIDDGVTSPIVRPVILHLAPRRLLFPVVHR